jgi:hypothetical protein
VSDALQAFIGLPLPMDLRGEKAKVFRKILPADFVSSQLAPTPSTRFEAAGVPHRLGLRQRGEPGSDIIGNGSHECQGETSIVEEACPAIFRKFIDAVGSVNWRLRRKVFIEEVNRFGSLIRHSKTVSDLT